MSQARAPAVPGLRSSVRRSGENPSGPAVVEAAVHALVGAPALGVGEDHLGQGIVGEPRRQHPPGAVGRQPHRVAEPAAAAGEGQGVDAEEPGRALLADHQVAGAVAAQVGQDRVAGAVAGHGQAGLFGEPVVTAEVEPAALVAAVHVAAGEGEVEVSVTVEVAGGHGEGVAAGEGQGPAEGAVAADGHQELGGTAGHEEQPLAADLEGGGQRRHRTHPLLLGEQLGLGQAGRLPALGGRHLGAAAGVDPALAAPVDARRPVVGGDDQLVAAVAVQVGGPELHPLDLGVDVSLGLDPQLGLMEQPHAALGHEGQVHPPVAVEVAGGHRGALVGGHQRLVALAQPLRRAEVDVGVQAAGVAALLVADDQVGVAVAADVGHRRRGAAAGGQLGEAALPEDVVIDVGRRRLHVDLGVAEHQVHVAVAVQVEVMDALQHAGAGDVEVLAGVAEGPPPEGLEAAGDPDVVVRWHGGSSLYGAVRAEHLVRGHTRGMVPGLRPAPSRAAGPRRAAP